VRCCSFTTVPICDDYEWMSSPRRGNLSMYFYVSFVVLPTVVGRLSRRRFCFYTSQTGVCSVLSPGTPTARLHCRRTNTIRGGSPFLLYLILTCM
jgi:hypothetical protein